MLIPKLSDYATKKYWRPCIKVNARGRLHSSAPQSASFSKKAHIVKLLLDNNAHSKPYRSALQVDSSRTSKYIVSLLLESGEEANVHCKEFGNALQVASKRGTNK